MTSGGLEQNDEHHAGKLLEHRFDPVGSRQFYCKSQTATTREPLTTIMIVCCWPRTTIHEQRTTNCHESQTASPCPGSIARAWRTEEDVIATIERGERFAAKHGRTGFRCNFPFNNEWNNRQYSTKQVEAYAVEEDGWLVITAMVKFF